MLRARSLRFFGRRRVNPKQSQTRAKPKPTNNQSKPNKTQPTQPTQRNTPQRNPTHQQGNSAIDIRRAPSIHEAHLLLQANGIIPARKLQKTQIASHYLWRNLHLGIGRPSWAPSVNFQINWNWGILQRTHQESKGLLFCEGFQITPKQNGLYPISCAQPMGWWWKQS